MGAVWRSRIGLGLALGLMACGEGTDPASPGADGGAAAPDAGGAPVADAAPHGTPDAVPPAVACDGLPDGPADQTLSIAVGGRTRTAMVHLPDGYDPTVPTPVVLNFHGLTSNASQQAGFSGMSAKADEAGFIAVHPEGVDNSWNAGGCCGDAAEMGIDDVGFVDALLDELPSVACVDTRRVYATGMSNGGFMSHKLGCDMADRIAAIASVTGVNAASPCNPGRPIPVLQIHGTADTVVDYAGTMPTIAGWVARNGCDDQPQVTYDNGDATCETYTGCDGGVTVEMCTIVGFGHWWPGAFGAATDLPATDHVWSFLSEYRL